MATNRLATLLALVTSMGCYQTRTLSVDVTALDVTASPVRVAADGYQTTTLQLQLILRGGAPPAGYAASFLVNEQSGFPGLVPAAATTDGLGMVTAMLGPLPQGTYHVRGLVLLDGFPTESGVDVDVVFAAPAGTVLLSTNGNAVADGVTQATVTAQVISPQHLPVVHAPVVITLADPNSRATLGTPSGAVTDNNGVVSVVATSTVAGWVPLHAASPYGMADTNAIFLPGPPVAILSSGQLNPNTVLADGVTAGEFTVHLADAFGNAAANVAVTFQTSGSAVTLAPPSGVTDGTGSITCAVTSLTVQSTTINATAGALTFTEPMSFILGPPDPNTSSVVLSPNSVPADGVTAMSMAVTVRDAGYHVLSGQHVVLGSAAPGPAFVPGAGTTDANGQVASVVTNTYAGRDNFYAMVGGNVPVRGSGTFTTLTPWCTNGNIYLPGAPHFQNTGARAYDVQAVDVNHDGFLDLVSVSDYAPGGPYVALGRGNGTFQTPAQIPTPYFSNMGLAVVDMNGDSNMDIAITVSNATNPASVVLFLGNGVGGFSQTANVNTQLQSANKVCAGDVNGDTKPDVVVTSLNDPNVSGDPNTIAVLTGDGTGNLSVYAYASIDRALVSCALVDINNDSKLDLVVGSYGDHRVNVSMNPGSGKFTVGSQYGNMGRIGPVAIIDVNKDSKLDLVYGGSGIGACLGTGNGNFTGCTATTNAVGPITALRVMDFTGDGNMDVVAADSLGYIAVGTGAGNGTFTLQEYSIGAQPLGLDLGDFNGDTKPDVAATLTWASDLVTYINAGASTFPPYPIQTIPTPQGVTAVDLNNDHRLDVVAYSAANANVYVAMGAGNGNFAAATWSPITAGVQCVGLGDVTGDGNVDMLVGNANSATVQVFLGLGNGNFNVLSAVPVGGNPNDLAIADLNTDGVPDIVAVSHSGALSIVLGIGSGAFQPAVTTVTTTPYAALTVADFNGDGSPDAVTADPSSGRVALFTGSPNGTLRQGPVIYTGGNPGYVNAGDFNGDGAPDVALGDVVSAQATVVLGVGDGTFDAPAPYVLQGVVARFEVADLDSDGIQDLLVATSGTLGGGTMSWLRGSGNGTFSPAVPYQTGDASGVVVGDFNGDGKRDAVVTNRDDNLMSTLLATGCH